jgi:YidC/Oxa1 family membrane protein insertase
MHEAVLAVAWLQSFLYGIGWLVSRVFQVIPNYALTVVVFTLAIRLILLPLGIKQIRSMQSMQAVQPKVKQLQAKYKGDRVRLNEEMMKLYKEHGVNPLSGCFPLIAQLPVLFALYAVLRVPQGIPHIPQNTALRQAIVQQDDRIHLFGANLLCPARDSGKTVPIPKTEFHYGIKQLECGASGSGARIPYYVLIVMMIGTTFYQQLQMQRASPGPANQQQRMLMYLMPVFFGYLGFSFPLGLVLYWSTTNLIQIAQQHFMLPKKGSVPPDTTEKGATRPGPKGPAADGSGKGKQRPSGGTARDGERNVRRVQGRPASGARRPPGNAKRSGNAASRKKRPQR